MNKKTLIIILAIVGVLCLCAVIAGIIIFTQAGKLVSENVSTSPEDVQSSAAAITEYTLPAGYTETFGMELFGVSMVGFSSSDNKQTLMMYQFPASEGMDSEQLAEQMRQMSESQTGQISNLQQVDSYPVVIRGQETEMIVYEGTSSDGDKIREVMAVFEGNGGTAFFMAVGPQNSWDQAAIDQFVGSLR